MKNEIKKGDVIRRGFRCNYETVIKYEALNDAAIGKFVKLSSFYYYKDANDNEQKKYTGEIIRKKVLSCNHDGVYVGF